MNTNDTTSRGRAFRRIGGAALATGAAVCAGAALLGTLPAQAAAPHPTAHSRPVAVHPVAKQQPSGAAGSAARAKAEKEAEVKRLEQAVAHDPAQQAIDAYYAAGYKYEDALDLAALWNSADRNQAKTTAGTALRAGHALPFTPGQGFQRSYTTAQQLHAFALTDVDDPGLADRLAASWKVSKQAAKAKAGALALANKPVPLQHPTPSAGDAAAAFFGAGYDYADAEKLAQLWKIDAYSAKIKAGQDLLATPAVPLPIQP